jgi:hypothetical protein
MGWVVLSGLRFSFLGVPVGLVWFFLSIAWRLGIDLGLGLGWGKEREEKRGSVLLIAWRGV